jgi:hypothetical protein
MLTKRHGVHYSWTRLQLSGSLEITLQTVRWCCPGVMWLMQFTTVLLCLWLNVDFVDFCQECGFGNRKTLDSTLDTIEQSQDPLQTQDLRSNLFHNVYLHKVLLCFVVAHKSHLTFLSTHLKCLHISSIMDLFLSLCELLRISVMTW